MNGAPSNLQNQNAPVSESDLQSQSTSCSTFMAILVEIDSVLLLSSL